MYSKMLILSLTLTVAACNSSSGSGEKPALNPAGVCVDRSEGIVGGQKVAEYDYDSNRVVMLLSEDSSGDVELCTAAPIAPDVLLTAAHCITATASKTKAYTTTSALCNSGFNRNQTGIVATAVVVNENYYGVENASLSSIKSDVALVFLSSKLPSNYPIYKIADSKKQMNSSLYLYGYGAISLNVKSSGILRKAEIQAGRFEIDQTIKEVSIDQTYGKGVCSGDSGGPGLVYLDGEYQILGVNSYVNRQHKGQDYCKVQGNLALADHYLSWIENKMAARGRQLKK